MAIVTARLKSNPTFTIQVDENSPILSGSNSQWEREMPATNAPQAYSPETTSPMVSPTSMVTIYGPSGETMQVMNADVPYWTKQGWFTTQVTPTTPVAPTSPPPQQGTTTIYNSSGTPWDVPNMDVGYYEGQGWNKNPPTTSTVTTPFYGSQANEDVNKDTWKGILGYLDYSEKQNVLSVDAINTVKNNPDLLKFYINAVAYGGYSVVDVVKDIKRQELIKGGNTAAANLIVIDPNITKSKFTNSATSNPLLSLPPAANESLYNTTLYNLPDEAFNTIVKPIDVTSQEFKDEVEAAKSKLYDVAIQGLEATNEREKAIADYNWQTTKTALEKSLNIQLSNNAFDAWGQLDSIGRTMASRGTAGTGMEEETTAKYLQAVRKSGQLLREAELDEKTTKELDYLLKSGSPEQIRDYLATTKDEKVKAIFQPSAEVAQYYSTENLKTMLPDWDPQEIQNLHDSMIDPYGNLRSQTYGTLMTNKIAQLQAQKGAAQTKVFIKATAAEEKAYKPFMTTEMAGEAGETFSKSATPTVTAPVSTSKINPLTGEEYSESSLPGGWELDPVTGRLRKKTT